MTSATPVSGTGITGGGSGYAALLAHAGWVLYGMELGSVTLKINNQHTLRISIGMPNFEMPSLDCTSKEISIQSTIVPVRKSVWK